MKTIEDRQPCCARHEALLARKANLSSRAEQFDLWLEEHCSVPRHFEDAADDDETMKALQRSTWTCEKCQQEAAVRWSLKILGLDNVEVWKGKEDEK